MLVMAFGKISVEKRMSLFCHFYATHNMFLSAFIAMNTHMCSSAVSGTENVISAEKEPLINTRSPASQVLIYNSLHLFGFKNSLYRYVFQ